MVSPKCDSDEGNPPCAPVYFAAEWVERVLEVCEREIGAAPLPFAPTPCLPPSVSSNKIHPMTDERCSTVLAAEWEKTQEEGATETDEGGPYHAANHARSGVRSLNPALDLTASGTVERPWSKHRLAAYARQQGFDNVTSQNAEEWVEDQNLTSQLPRHYLEQQDWSDKHPGQTTDELSRGFQALKVHGTGYWGTNMSLDDEMDANVDPWFHSNQDTNTSLNVFQGHAVDPTLELHFRAKLSEFEEACTVAAKCHKARQRQVFATENAEEDQMMNEHVSLPASSVFENRKRTATLASNKWIDNEDMMPSKEWDPSLPRVSPPRLSSYPSSPPSPPPFLSLSL